MSLTPKSKKDKKIEILGEGVHGRVFSVENIKTGEIHAMKKYPKPFLEEGTLREISLMRELDHPNLQNFTEVNINERYIILPKARCNLDYYICETGFSIIDPLFRVYVYQLVCAINYLHSQNLRHGDIKPYNVLIYYSETPTNKTLVLTDFGLTTTIVGKGKRKEPAQSYYYRAPEVTEDWCPSGKETDIYALGLVIMEMVTGYLSHYSKGSAKSDLELARATLFRKFFKKVEPGELRSLVSGTVATEKIRTNSYRLVRDPYFVGFKPTIGNPIHRRKLPRLSKNQIEVVKHIISDSSQKFRSKYSGTQNDSWSKVSSVTPKVELEFYHFLVWGIKIFARAVKNLKIHEINNETMKIAKGCFALADSLGNTSFIFLCDRKEAPRIFESLNGRLYFHPELDPKKFIEELLTGTNFRMKEKI